MSGDCLTSLGACFHTYPAGKVKAAAFRSALPPSTQHRNLESCVLANAPLPWVANARNSFSKTTAAISGVLTTSNIYKNRLLYIHTV